VAYQCWTHVALTVGDLKQAEEFYSSLFGLTVAFREAEAADGWRTFPEEATWETARVAGIEPQLSQLRRDGVVLALEAAADGKLREAGKLSHIGIAVDELELAELRQRAQELGCHLVTNREGLIVFDDIYGVRWEVGTSTELTSNGARTGRWFDLDKP
jgi:catechol 2,3-dioxygenase-like lactoylglutathione lyase family enzyme